MQRALKFILMIMRQGTPEALLELTNISKTPMDAKSHCDILQLRSTLKRGLWMAFAKVRIEVRCCLPACTQAG
jgi:hypothetical protein